MSLKSFLAKIFTWWDGPTFGTSLWSRRHGQEVGRDGDGNVYMQTADGKRRWVMYAHGTDSSQVPPEWNLWLHRTRDAAPSEIPLPVKSWEKPWQPNATGSAGAYLPPGALQRSGNRPRSSGDYSSWTPDGDEQGQAIEDARSA